MLQSALSLRGLRLRVKNKRRVTQNPRLAAPLELSQAGEIELNIGILKNIYKESHDYDEEIS